MPSLALFNRQRKKRVNLFEFRTFAESAIVEVTELKTAVVLPEEINVIFVSDARIAAIHRQYMSVDGPTDVITFGHGEIVISVETAQRQAKTYASSFEHELRLYCVHGLLHLAGFDDLTDAGFRRMAKLQERIVGAVVSVSCRLSAGARIRDRATRFNKRLADGHPNGALNRSENDHGG
jgi:probable rRNA maturation factor